MTFGICAEAIRADRRFRMAGARRAPVLTPIGEADDELAVCFFGDLPEVRRAWASEVPFFTRPGPDRLDCLSFLGLAIPNTSEIEIGTPAGSRKEPWRTA